MLNIIQGNVSEYSKMYYFITTSFNKISYHLVTRTNDEKKKYGNYQTECN